MRNRTKIMMVVCLACLCSACSTNNEKKKVALIVKSTTSQFFQSVQSGANAASKEYNIELSYMGPENEEDYQAQVNMIHKAIEDRVDAIVLSAIDYNKLVVPVEEAVHKGIPVISIDSDVNSTKVSRRISTNNITAGEMAGNALEAMPTQDIRVGIVNFDANTANGQEREMGFKNVLKNNPNVKEIYTTNVQSNVDSAMQGTIQLLKDHPDMNAIVTFNEWTTLGVGYAIQQAQAKDTLFVVGFDNNPVSVGMLETQEVDALIVQNPFVMGYLGIEEAQQLLNGRKRNEAIEFTKTVLVHKDNMFDSEIQKILFPFD